MPKSPRKLSGPQREVIDVFAHILAASDIAKIEGMEGFFEQYVRDTLSLEQKAIWQALLERSRQVKKDLADRLEKERSNA